MFSNKRNRTLDRHLFYSKMQQPGESLQLFWHTFNGLVALCDFVEITNTMVLDMFILHMNNKRVQELCTESREPEQALEFAIAVEAGVKRQKSYGIQAAEPSTTVVKSEPVYAIEKTTNIRENFRSGELNFTPQHIENCVATNNQCKFCELVGHLKKCCNKKLPQ